FPPVAGSACHISWHWTLSRCRQIRFLRALRAGSFAVIYLYLFIVVGMLREPVVRHFSGNLLPLPLVSTADDLDVSTLQPVEEGFQSGAGHCADLFPDDHARDELVTCPVRGPLSLATPMEE
ncbi:MAG: hypothetical protein AB2556_26620, partial [Candidatus Thiodiazotropha sp.]